MMPAEFRAPAPPLLPLCNPIDVVRVRHDAADRIAADLTRPHTERVALLFHVAALTGQPRPSFPQSLR